MYSEARKLHLIEEMLKVKSESIWIALEDVLKSEVKNDIKKTNIYDFVGVLSEKQAFAMKDAIAEACEIIDDNDWK